MSVPDSVTVLMSAAKARIKTIFSFTDDGNVGVSYDGQPPAYEGEEFFQVHLASWTNKSVQSLDEYIDLDVTLTRRTGYAPQDRVGSDTMMDLTAGLLYRSRQVAIGFHMDYAMLDLCGGTKWDSTALWTGGQTYSFPTTVDGFREPLMFSTADKIEPRGPDWFWAQGYSEGPTPPTGISITLHFLGARRTQNISTQV